MVPFLSFQSATIYLSFPLLFLLLFVSFLRRPSNPSLNTFRHVWHPLFSFYAAPTLLPLFHSHSNHSSSFKACKSFTLLLAAIPFPHFTFLLSFNSSTQPLAGRHGNPINPHWHNFNHLRHNKAKVPYSRAVNLALTILSHLSLCFAFEFVTKIGMKNIKV